MILHYRRAAPADFSVRLPWPDAKFPRRIDGFLGPPARRKVQRYDIAGFGIDFGSNSTFSCLQHTLLCALLICWPIFARLLGRDSRPPPTPLEKCHMPASLLQCNTRIANLFHRHIFSMPRYYQDGYFCAPLIALLLPSLLFASRLLRLRPRRRHMTLPTSRLIVAADGARRTHDGRGRRCRAK